MTKKERETVDVKIKKNYVSSGSTATGWLESGSVKT
jgi:hypothetical protein